MVSLKKFHPASYIFHMFLVGSVFSVTLFLTVNLIVMLFDGGNGADIETAIESFLFFYIIWIAMHCGYALCYNLIAKMTGGFSFNVDFIEVSDYDLSEEAFNEDVAATTITIEDVPEGKSE